jgi:hypothetical protein
MYLKIVDIYEKEHFYYFQSYFHLRDILERLIFEKVKDWDILEDKEFRVLNAEKK